MLECKICCASVADSVADNEIFCQACLDYYKSKYDLDKEDLIWELAWIDDSTPVL